MLISRRKLLERGGLLAAMAVVPEALLFQANGATVVKPGAGPAKTGMRPFGKEMFASLQGSNFRISAKGVTSQWLTLISVDDIAEPEPANMAAFAVQPAASNRLRPRSVSFSARFYGGLTQLAQGTYTFENEKTGKFSLFIVPSGQNLYLATFNQLQ